MKVTISQIAPHPQGLVLGVRIEHEKAGWVRFSTTVLVSSELTRMERVWLLDMLNGARDDVLDYVDEELPIDWK